MTRDDAITALVAELHTVLFNGYFCQDRDPARLYVQMKNDDRRIREKVGEWYDKLTRTNQEIGTNGKATATGTGGAAAGEAKASGQGAGQVRRAAVDRQVPQSPPAK